MAEWAPPQQDSSSKRRAEATNLLQVARKRQHVNPGREYVEPRVYQQPSYGYEQQQQQQDQVRCGMHRPPACRQQTSRGGDPAAVPAMGGGARSHGFPLQRSSRQRQSNTVANTLLVSLWMQGTDFSTWTEAELKQFLDARGGDFDTSTTPQQLVRDILNTFEFLLQPAEALKMDNKASKDPLAITYVSLVVHVAAHQLALALSPLTVRDGDSHTPTALSAA